jgi:CheY-like chemotaxis protein/HPt (histidine-containing phosphotransfer) domain-containing protein
MGKRGDAARLDALGCSAYLLKPVKQQMLREALMAVMSQNQQEEPRLLTRHQLSEQNRQHFRILLAEDNLINQKLAVTLLQKAGYSVDAVESGVHAVEKARNGHYHAILMDVQMSEMDGFEATHLIRAWEQENGAHTPIIAMTAHALSGDRERCIEAGMDDYLSKPLEPKVFFAMLERWTQNEEKTVSTFESTELTSPVDEYVSIQAPLFEDDGLFGEEIDAVVQPAQQQPQPPCTPKDFTNIPPMNIEEALVHFDGDRTFMAEMFAFFLSGLQERYTEIHCALENNNANHLGRLAHNLKGTCLNFGTEPLAVLAAELEEMGKREDLHAAQSLVEEMERQIQRLQSFAQTEYLLN